VRRQRPRKNETASVSRQVGEHRIVPGPDVPHEGVLAAFVHVQLDVLTAGRVQSGEHLQPGRRGHVRIPRPEHDHHAAVDARSAGERPSVGVRPQRAVVKAGGVEAHGRGDPRVEGRPERQVPSDAETRGEQLPHVVALLHPVQHRDTVGVEIRDGRRRGARLPRRLALVVELQGDAGELPVRVDLGHHDDEPVRSQAPGGAQGRLRQLEDVGVEQDPRVSTAASGTQDDRPDVAAGRGHAHLVLTQLHGGSPYAERAALPQARRAPAPGQGYNAGNDHERAGVPVDNPIERPLRVLDDWQQRHRVSAILVAVVKKFGDDQAGNFVALLTYYAFVSTFPLLLVLVTVTEIVLGSHPELRRQLLDTALSEFPIAGPTLQQSVRTPSGSGLALVVGLAAAFWGGSGLAGTMQTVLNSLWMVPKRQWPGFPWNYLRSIALLLLLGIGVVLSALMAAFAGAGHVLGLSGTGVHLLTIVLTTVVYCGLFLLGFRLALSRQVPTRDLVLGAVLSGIAWQVLLTLGGTLATHLFRSREVTGVFALVLGLLGWFALQATVTVYVVELDVVRTRHLWPRALAQPPLTQADEEYLRASAEAQARRPEQRVQVDFDDGDPSGS
jgi:uncharacterized BrkB/YihY/UPF0761 family membrane protein